MAMLREARNVGFVRVGIFGKRWGLLGLNRAGTPAGPTIRGDDYERLLVLQTEVPVLIDDSRDRRCWWHLDEFYFSDPDLESDDVHALLIERRMSKERRLARARSLAARDRAPTEATFFQVDRIDIRWEEVHITAGMAQESLDDYQQSLDRIELGDLSDLEPQEDVADAVKRVGEGAKFAQEMLAEGGRSYRRIFHPTASPPRSIAIADGERFRELAQRQRHEPVRIGSDGSLSYWWYLDVFYEGPLMIEADEVAASANAQGGRPRRQPIPVEVRRAVFERDGGRCVECDATFDLQYDHVIPIALGGANSEQNLQLLCGGCNRRKADSI